MICVFVGLEQTINPHLIPCKNGYIIFVFKPLMGAILLPATYAKSHLTCPAFPNIRSCTFWYFNTVIDYPIYLTMELAYPLTRPSQ